MRTSNIPGLFPFSLNSICDDESENSFSIFHIWDYMTYHNVKNMRSSFCNPYILSITYILNFYPFGLFLLGVATASQLVDWCDEAASLSLLASPSYFGLTQWSYVPSHWFLLKLNVDKRLLLNIKGVAPISYIINYKQWPHDGWSLPRSHADTARNGDISTRLSAHTRFLRQSCHILNPVQKPTNHIFTW